MKLLKNIFSISDNIPSTNIYKIFKIFGIKIKIKKYHFGINYLKNRFDNIITRNVCPLCNNNEYLLNKEYKINDLIEDWKQHYAFIPIGDNYRDKILERRICKKCGLHYYNYFIPDTEEFYDKLSSLHPLYTKYKWDYDEALKVIEQYKPNKVLDIGCGFGYFIDKIKNYVNYVAGTEFNKIAKEKCAKKNIKIYDIDLSNIDEKFDMITAFQVLEHVTDINTFIKDAVNLLNPGGILLLVTPNPESEFIKYKTRFLELPPHHNLDISKKVYEYISQNNNLEIIKYKTQDISLYDYEVYLKAKHNLIFNKQVTFNFYLKEKNDLIGKSHLALFKKI